MSERKCVCPQFVTRSECIEIRYGKNEDREECECLCHDEQEMEDALSDYPAAGEPEYIE